MGALLQVTYDLIIQPDQDTRSQRCGTVLIVVCLVRGSTKRKCRSGDLSRSHGGDQQQRGVFGRCPGLNNDIEEQTMVRGVCCITCATNTQFICDKDSLSAYCWQMVLSGLPGEMTSVDRQRTCILLDNCSSRRNSPSARTQPASRLIIQESMYQKCISQARTRCRRQRNETARQRMG